MRTENAVDFAPYIIGLSKNLYSFWNKGVFLECIMCKPTSLCKLYELQSEPPDQHPRGDAGEVGEGIYKNVITQSKSERLIVKLPNFPCPLDVDPMVQIENS